MGECRIRWLLLDYGGVVAEEGFALGLRALARELERDEAHLWREGLRAVWDSGYVTGRAGEADFWRLFKERSGLDGDEARWREDILSRFVVRPRMLELADRFRAQGRTAAVLSDQTDWLERLDAAQGFSRHFDAVFNSWRHGMTKQEPAYFLLALERLGAEPGRTLFVDDNPGNVERARALGMGAILYVDQPGFERELAAYCPGLLD
ncbi:Alpha-D-glucose 1-phosphate phosphatase YihX [Fundidesulfovibrio magnetotacticus]|uniref:Alpha-D-glucose 1-phosphate phosphatase YihX n=1 Tax=Fundidesulfovibrio magnetotacticus TaxID=2730080 RepID=A0A6V8LPZ0_9BACT|nr:HAD family phosphatase [Fundidesulfovibrio magnetotacticus]GFK92621.1 Alpha-D-glucose 1-phosphate phosphatase YihX [Fundidesulfovibrio magnetotacticus]